MDNSKRLTLEALVAKAEQRRQEKFETHQVEVPSLGGALQLEKILRRAGGLCCDPEQGAAGGL